MGSNGMTVPILSWFDDPAKKSIGSVFDGLNKGVEALDIFHKYRKNHFRRLHAELENIKILGMQQPIKLVDVYSPAMVSTTIFGRLYEQDWLSAEHPQDPSPIRRRIRDGSKRADEFIENHKRVAVLGAAGSGKTTLLRHLALTYSDETMFKASKLETSRLPFFVSLLTYSRCAENGISLESYIAENLEKYTDDYAPYFVQRVLSKGLAVVILDSLDEVPSSRREQVIAQIRDLCLGYPDCGVVLSSRTADYTPVDESFWEVELTRLTDKAVNTIVDAWFDEEPERAKELRKHLRRDEGVRSLCETPLLLSLLCIQFRHDLALPKRKTELYRRCIDAFLRDWDASRGFRRDTAYSMLSDDRKERIFESVAGTFFTDDTRYVFPESRLVSRLADCCDLFEIDRAEAPAVLREIESHHGILERFSADSFMFSHPSFQEYFCARHILAQREEMATLKQHYKDDRWSSVIEFMVTLHNDPSNMLMFLVDKSEMSTIKNFPPLALRTRILLLLYRCLIAGATIPAHTRSVLHDHIIQSHFHMSNTFANAGVFPMAVLMPGGVRHSYVFVRKRPTLHQALQPLRLLANEILLSTSGEYAARVVERLADLEPGSRGLHSLSRIATSLCLGVPIAPARPEAVMELLARVEKDGPPYIRSIASETRDEMVRQGLINPPSGSMSNRD